MKCCFLQLQKRDKLSYSLPVDKDRAGLQYLKTAKDIFVRWKAFGTADHTNEAYTASILTMNAFPDLVKHWKNTKFHMFYLENSCQIPLKGGVDGTAKYTAVISTCRERSVASRKENKKAEFASTVSINVSSWIICTRSFTNQLQQHRNSTNRMQHCSNCFCPLSVCLWKTCQLMTSI